MVQIISEAEKYSDILLGDYTDTYANLTVKEGWKIKTQLTLASSYQPRVRPPQDVDVLTVLILGRPTIFRKFTSSSPTSSVVQESDKICSPRTSSSLSWSSSTRPVMRSSAPDTVNSKWLFNKKRHYPDWNGEMKIVLNLTIPSQLTTILL